MGAIAKTNRMQVEQRGVTRSHRRLPRLHERHEFVAETATWLWPAMFGAMSITGSRSRMEWWSVYSTYADAKRLVKDVGCGRPIKPGDIQGNVLTLESEGSVSVGGCSSP